AAAGVVVAAERDETAAGAGEHLEHRVERAVAAAGVRDQRPGAGRRVGEPDVVAGRRASPRLRRRGADGAERAVLAVADRERRRAVVVDRRARDVELERT